jgi:hypothetical protein
MKGMETEIKENLDNFTKNTQDSCKNHIQAIQLT